MKKNILTLFLFITFVSVYAQRKISFGLELGVNASTSPSKEIYVDEKQNYLNMSTVRPVISPKLGIWSRGEFGKHLYVNLGLQFNQVGYNYLYSYHGYDQTHQTEHYTRYKKNLVINKLSAPLTIGYQTKIGKSTFYLGMGYKKQYHLGGEYKIFYLSNSDPMLSEGGHFNSKLFDNNGYRVRRWNSGLQAEIGLNVSNKISFEINYGLNKYLSIYNQYQWEGRDNYMDSHELSINFKYKLQQHVKNLE
jgi:hypothetical protein